MEARLSVVANPLAKTALASDRLSRVRRPAAAGLLQLAFLAPL